MAAKEQQEQQQSLFSDFTTPGKAAWEEKVIQDLKGKEISTLTWHPYEGFPVAPMLFREDVSDIEHLGFMPDFAPYHRGSTPASWTIAQIIDEIDPEVATEEIERAVNNGQQAVGIHFDRQLHRASSLNTVVEEGGTEGLAVYSLKGMKTIADVLGEETPLEIYGGMASPVLAVLAEESGCLVSHVEFDPLGTLAAEGALPMSMECTFRLAADGIRMAENDGQTALSVSGEPYQNAGASAVEELGCVLAAGVEYLHRLQDIGLDARDIASRMRFTFPVGTNFFMEIAKLRAARMLWALIVRQFGVEDENAQRMRIMVRSSRWFQTKYDPYVNMLRTTVEAIAGAVGGADAMHTAPFDEIAGEPGPFSRRIARNTQIVLREESHLSQVVDPAGGSYYVEALTDSLARHAWDFFREIEAKGGFVAALEDGIVQARINARADEKRRNISRRRDVLVGTTQYPNISEKPLPQAGQDPFERAQRMRNALRAYVDDRGERNADALAAALEDPDAKIGEALRKAVHEGLTVPEISQMLCASGITAPTVQPLTAFRGADTFERIRDAVTRAPKKPTVFLATLGPVFWRRARATFSSGFFGVAGMEIIDNLGFESPQEAANAAIDAHADIVVACSDDERYGSLVPDLINALAAGGKKPLVIVAGNPKDDIEALTKAGVNTFIHLKTDAGETLAAVLETLGIEIQ